MKITSPYTYPQKWLKGNLHTHTTISDGAGSPQEIVSAYRDDNYDFLAITDHGKLSRYGGLDAGRMLLVPGEECHMAASSGAFDYHFVGIGLKKEIPDQASPQTVIDLIAKNGGLPFVAHPRWSFMPYELFEGLYGFAGFEVYNGVCDKGFGRGCSNDFWDAYMTRFKRPIFAIAVDDNHGPHRDFARGWTWVNAARRPKAILDALRRGDAYASTGPRIETIRATGGSITVYTSSAKAVKFISTEGRVPFLVEGEHVKSAAFAPKGDEVYVRVEVHGHDGTVAWSNPFFIEPD